MKRTINALIVLALILGSVSGVDAQSPNVFQNSGFKIGRVSSSDDVYGLFPAGGVLARVTTASSTTVFYVEVLKGLGGGVGSYTLDDVFVGSYQVRGISCYTAANEGTFQYISAYDVETGKLTVSTAWGTALVAGDVVSIEPKGTGADRYILVDTGTLADPAGVNGWDSTGTHVILDVTGLVRVKILVECVTNLAGGTATCAVGATGAATTIIGTTTATTIDAGIWINNTGETAILVTPANSIFDYVTPGDDIIFTLATANLSAGRLKFHCWVTPLAPGASVVPNDDGI